MDLGIKNKKVLITGASKGIGKEIAIQFAREGCQLILVARDELKLKTLLKKINNKKNSIYVADLLLNGSPTKIAKEIIKKYNNIDIIVHNVGGGLGIGNYLADIKEWEKVWKFNAGISIEMNNILLPSMLKKKWGRIINISSINSKNGGTASFTYGSAPAYSCSKAFLSMYTKTVGRELAKSNVVMSSVMPGPVASKGKYWDRLSKTNPSLVKKYLKNCHAIQRFANPSEIAPFVLMLASKYASYAATSEINIDGGSL